MRRTISFVLGTCLALGAKTYAVDGIVVAVDAAARTMLVSHRAIEHYMPAMMMPFAAEDGSELKGLHPGSRIQFELTVTKARSVARHIRPTGEADGAIPPPAGKLEIGAELPDFSLTDQNGRVVRLSEWRGKVVAIDFIYTRCPLPDVCPRMSANFAMLQRQYAGQGLGLISVTVDPDYDRPEVLREYARRWGAGGGWRFLTGDVGPLAKALGEVYWADEGSIGHNSTTTIIGRDGRVAAVLEGSNFRWDQLAHVVGRILEGQR
ncbi:MAG TPA: SCO family protein [Candidatus Sulfopaludibacter sp.]|jgi:protein SCO1/2|nr:SCO family protein [Candidatus Sulfopaludibacter sp.]